jgi:hypothetical protein
MKKLENQKEKTMQEICKRYGEAIPGYPNYRITRDGKVYSNRLGKYRLLRVYNRKCNTLMNGEVIYRPVVRIYGKPELLYRLLAIVYIPNPDNKPLVCHKDNNPLNLEISNLYWGNHSDNALQAVVDGRHNPNKGNRCKWFRHYSENHPTAKLTLIQAEEIRKSNLSVKELAIKYGVCRGTIRNILKGLKYVKV